MIASRKFRAMMESIRELEREPKLAMDELTNTHLVRTQFMVANGYVFKLGVRAACAYLRKQMG